MNFLKKIFKRKKVTIPRDKNENKKEPECWYNNVHEKGEALRGDMPYGTGGSEGIFMNIANSGH